MRKPSSRVAGFADQTAVDSTELVALTSAVYHVLGKIGADHDASYFAAREARSGQAMLLKVTQHEDSVVVREGAILAPAGTLQPQLLGQVQEATTGHYDLFGEIVDSSILRFVGRDHETGGVVGLEFRRDDNAEEGNELYELTPVDLLPYVTSSSSLFVNGREREFKRKVDIRKYMLPAGVIVGGILLVLIFVLNSHDREPVVPLMGAGDSNTVMTATPGGTIAPGSVAAAGAVDPIAASQKKKPVHKNPPATTATSVDTPSTPAVVATAPPPAPPPEPPPAPPQVAPQPPPSAIATVPANLGSKMTAVVHPPAAAAVIVTAPPPYIPQKRVLYTLDGTTISLELGTNRPGSDYARPPMGSNSPKSCTAACARDTKCKSYTFTAPRPDVPQPMCFLRDTVWPARPCPSCTSGVKQ
jgi:hypothetical protein